MQELRKQKGLTQEKLAQMHPSSHPAAKSLASIAGFILLASGLVMLCDAMK